MRKYRYTIYNQITQETRQVVAHTYYQALASLGWELLYSNQIKREENIQ